MADSQEAVTEASPFDESASQSDAPYDESPNENGNVVIDCDDTSQSDASYDESPNKHGNIIIIDCDAATSDPETQEGKEKPKGETAKSNKKKKAAKPTDAETQKPVKKRRAGQALSDPPSTEKTQIRQRLHQ